MALDLFRSPAAILSARREHAVCLGLAAWFRRRIAAGETDQREAHAWALGRAKVLRLRVAEFGGPL